MRYEAKKIFALMPSQRTLCVTRYSTLFLLFFFLLDFLELLGCETFINNKKINLCG